MAPGITMQNSTMNAFDKLALNRINTSQQQAKRGPCLLLEGFFFIYERYSEDRKRHQYQPKAYEGVPLAMTRAGGYHPLHPLCLALSGTRLPLKRRIPTALQGATITRAVPKRQRLHLRNDDALRITSQAVEQQEPPSEPKSSPTRQSHHQPQHDDRPAPAAVGTVLCPLVGEVHLRWARTWHRA